MSTPTTQIIRPAGAGHETLYVLLLCLMILMVAGSVVAGRGESRVVGNVETHQLDARRDLSAAEQGLGTLVVVKRFAFFSEAVGHAALTGVAIGILLGEPYAGPYGSLFGCCLLFGILLNYLRLRRHRADPNRLIFDKAGNHRHLSNPQYTGDIDRQTRARSGRACRFSCSGNAPARRGFTPSSGFL
jgi:hypothetical protein